MTRRDKCFELANEARELSDTQACYAWRKMTDLVEAMGEADLPKFQDLFTAMQTSIDLATVECA